MGAGSVARVAALVVALAPAIAWYVTPAHPLAAIVVGCVAIAAALHGLGGLVGRAVDDPDAPVALTIAWGLGAWLGLAGLAAATGGLTLPVQHALLVAGTAYGAWWWAGRAARATVRWRPAPADAMTLVAALAVATATLHTLGAASTFAGSYFDGDGFLLGPLERLATTGTLGDPVGLPRATGLGGNVMLNTLSSAFGDWRMCHGIDRGLGLALVLALAVGGATRSTARPYVGVITIALVSATPEYTVDLAPRWTTVALVFALLATWRRVLAAGAAPRRGLAAVLLAAGFATITHAGFGLTAAVLAALAKAMPPGAERRRVLQLAGGLVFLVLVGYVIAAVRAAGDVPGAASTLAMLRRGLVGRLVMFGVVAAVVHALAALATRGDGDRALAIVLRAVAVAAAVGGALAPSPLAGWHQIQALGIAVLLVLLDRALVDPERLRRVTPAALIAVMSIALLLATTRFPTGWPPMSWQGRLVDLVEAARARAHPPGAAPTREASDYRTALAAIPRGARVGLWVDRADLVDYRHHTIVELRSQDAAQCVAITPRRWWRRSARACRRVAALLPRLELDYVVIAPSAMPRPDDFVGRQVCSFMRPDVCVDPLTRFVAQGTPLPARGELVVIHLTRLTPRR